MSDEVPSRSSVTDSPWFWVTLFCSASLIVLVIGESQVDKRQVRIERQTQGRARAAEMATSGEATTEMSTLGNTQINTMPLIVILSIVLLISGNMFWYWRWQQRRLENGRSLDGPQSIGDGR